MTLKVAWRMGDRARNGRQAGLPLPGTLLPCIPRCLGNRWGHAHTGLTRDTLTLGDTLTHIGTQRSGDTCHLSHNPHSKPLHTQMQPAPCPQGRKVIHTRSGQKAQLGLKEPRVSHPIPVTPPLRATCPSSVKMRQADSNVSEAPLAPVL